MTKRFLSPEKCCRFVDYGWFGFTVQPLNSHPHGKGYWLPSSIETKTIEKP